jgi:hypothetical protein
MHDGVFRIAGLTAAEKRFALRLKSSDFLSVDELADDLLALIAEQCRIPSELLPDSQPDLFFEDKLAQIERTELNAFARDVLRGLRTGACAVNENSQRFNESVEVALDTFLNAKRGLFEIRTQPEFERALADVFRRYDDAALKIMSRLPALLEQFGTKGAIKVHRIPTHLDVDQHIPGADLNVK